MDVNLEQPTIQPTRPVLQEPVQRTDVQSNTPSPTEQSTQTDSQLSDTGKALASQTVSPPATELKNADQAQQSVAQFQQDAESKPGLTLNTQAGSATSNLIKNLLG